MPKYDSGKPRFSLIDPKFMLEFAQVMTMGAENMVRTIGKLLKTPSRDIRMRFTAT